MSKLRAEMEREEEESRKSNAKRNNDRTERQVDCFSASLFTEISTNNNHFMTLSWVLRNT